MANKKQRLERLEQQHRTKETFCPESTILLELMGMRPGECVTVTSNLKYEREILEGLEHEDH